ncbi:MAG: DNA methyltransferase [Hyphomonadaceae bacterium]|nr:DNA methyltransferase [Hyphomonadaceae bacterium]
MQIAYKPISSLKPATRNARKHPQKQIDQIARSIEANGFIAPIIIDGDGTIVSGHGRLMAAAKLGLSVVPTICIEHLSPEQQRVYALADNKIAQNASWDEDVLTIEIRELESAGQDLTITGFETAEIDGLLMTSYVQLNAEADNIPEIPADPVSKIGDLWQLNEHKIICGDVRKEATLSALMGKERAQATFSDPPYNVRIQGHVVTRTTSRHREFAMASGEMSTAEFTAFLEDALSPLAAYSSDGSLHYVCMDWRHVYELWAAGLTVFSELKNLCVWDKVNAGMGSFYRSQHELIFVFKLGSAPHINNVQLGKFGRNRSNVWAYQGLSGFSAERSASLAMHPTVKPIALVRDAILDCTERGQIVIDGFSGSGTTILAAEQAGRIVRAVEIDPAYVDVAIKRWQNMTGQPAILAETGETFEQVSRSRGTAKASLGAAVSDERQVGRGRDVDA